MITIYIYLIKLKYTSITGYKCRMDGTESALIRINVRIVGGWKSIDENQRNVPQPGCMAQQKSLPESQLQQSQAARC